jgi:hypothetical protein
MALRPLDGYPTSIGSSRASVFPHAGPSSYTQVTIVAATAIAGGDTIRASEAGAKFFDYLAGGTTDDGAFSVRAVPNAPSTSINGASAATYTLMWIANKTAALGGQNQTAGVEAVAATDLSTFIVRLLGIFSK